MANSFEPFDKTPVPNGLNAKHCGLTIREIIFAAVTVILLAVCLVFIALYVTKTTDSSEDFCVTKECMETTSYSIQLMNSSVDPCENFYQYACGNYKTDHPAIDGQRTVLGDLKDFNTNRLEEIILKGYSSRRPKYDEDAYDVKLYDFMFSCRYGNNGPFQDFSFPSMGLSSQDQIVSKLGGWDLLGTWDETNWDFNTVFKKVQSDFMVSALVSTTVVFNKTESYIEIMSNSREDHMPIGYANRMMDNRDYIQRLGSLLLRDATVTNVTEQEQEVRLDQFVNDTSLIMTKMSYFPPQNSRMEPPAYKELITIKEVSEITKGVIDWEGLLSYKFRPATINTQTNVMAFREDLMRISDVIGSLPDVDRKRILHNYLIFCVFDFYVQGLQEEYMILKSGYDGVPGFRNLDKYCMQMAQYYMKDALGALYVKKYFDYRGKQKAMGIIYHLKRVLQSVVGKTPWMDEKTKENAISELDTTSFKIGYPDWMDDEKLVDAKYKGFFDTKLKFIDHLLTGNQFIRLSYAKDLIAKDRKEEWISGVYDTEARFVWYRNELIVTAGLLQNPIYDVDAPLYKTFGSLGAILGRYLHHIVDGYGEHFNQFGGAMEDKSWWSDQSIKMYRDIQKCVEDVYSKVFWTIEYPNGVASTIPLRADVPVSIATTSGIRLALKGYRDWEKFNGVSEKMPPSLGLTAEQMFFLSYAQNYCSSSVEDKGNGKLEAQQVNVPLGQLHEFSDAFQCKPKSKMNHEKKCPYY